MNGKERSYIPYDEIKNSLRGTFVKHRYCLKKKLSLEEIPFRDAMRNGKKSFLSEFRKEKGRKIFGLKYKDYIEGVVCVAYTDDIPTTVKELDLMSKDEGTIAVAYTVWSLKKGAGKKIMEELLRYMKYRNKVESVMTLSPLTPMATHFHIRNGAKLIQINPTTQNFEYKI